jgi:hypothetical protein
MNCGMCVPEEITNLLFGFGERIPERYPAQQDQEACTYSTPNGELVELSRVFNR